MDTIKPTVVSNAMEAEVVWPAAKPRHTVRAHQRSNFSVGEQDFEAARMLLVK